MKIAIAQLFSGNLLSKLLGLVREVLTAACFGTGTTAGAYRVAQTGTLVPVNFFTSDSLNAAFIPLYRRYRVSEPDKALLLLWEVFALFTILGAIISIGIAALAPGWVGLLAPGLNAETRDMAVRLLRVMALGVPFYLWSMIFIFRAMAHDDFVPMALRPSVQNVGMIVGVLLAFSSGEVSWLAWGFTASYIGLFAWSLYRAMSDGSLRWPRHWQSPQVSEVASAFWNTLKPLLLLPFLLQGNIVTERAVASLVSVAAVAAIDYSRFITETIVLLLAIPVAYAGLSRWSDLDTSSLARQLRQATLLLLLIGVPCSLFLFVNADLLVQMLYRRGAFDEVSAATTSLILQGAAVGLWAQVVGYVLIKALNAQMRNRMVLGIMAAALLVNVAINLLLYRHLGAWVLGVSNSAYGIVLFVGALWANGLWRDCAGTLMVLLTASVLYLGLHALLDWPQSLWWRLMAEVAVIGVFWTLFVVTNRRFRQTLIGVLKMRKAGN